MPGVQTRARTGFTLIEVLIATSLLTIGLGTAAMLMASAYGSYRNQNRTLEMNHLVHDQMEKLTSTAYETLKADVAGARNPGDPFREQLPPERDFEKAQDVNGVVAKYELIPPDDSDKEGRYAVRRKTEGRDMMYIGSGKRPNNVDVTMRLEFWDPQFDGPAAADKGLVRAQYDIEWNGTREHGVKYLAR